MTRPMRWPVFFTLAYLALGVELGLAPLWSIGGVTPSPVWVLVVFVAMSAPPTIAIWSALLMGAALDLSHIYGTAGGVTDLVLIGPMTLGFLVGAWVTLQFRSAVYRGSPIALAVMTALAGAFAFLVATAVVAARAFPFLTNEPIENWTASGELVHRALQLLYTTCLAIPMGSLLLRLVRWFGFEPSKGGVLTGHARR